jgi:hypothetical protein
LGLDKRSDSPGIDIIDSHFLKQTLRGFSYHISGKQLVWVDLTCHEEIRPYDFVFEKPQNEAYFLVLNTCVGIFFHLKEDAREAAILTPSGQI